VQAVPASVLYHLTAVLQQHPARAGRYLHQSPSVWQQVTKSSVAVLAGCGSSARAGRSPTVTSGAIEPRCPAFWHINCQSGAAVRYNCPDVCWVVLWSSRPYSCPCTWQLDALVLVEQQPPASGHECEQRRQGCTRLRSAQHGCVPPPAPSSALLNCIQASHMTISVDPCLQPLHWRGPNTLCQAQPDAAQPHAAVLWEICVHDGWRGDKVSTHKGRGQDQRR